MKVTIITVCKNSQGTIRDTINSVLNQDYADIEYIVIDGKSTDNTLKILDIYKKDIAVILSEPDEGLYDAINKGISLASGDVIAILNSDDFYISNDVISKVVSAFKANSFAAIIFGDLVYVERYNIKKITRYFSSKSFRPWKLRFGWMPPHPATFVLSKVYKTTGVYSRKYKISADFEMFIRAFLVHRFEYYHLNEIIVKMRLGGISTSGLKANFISNMENIRACRDNGVFTNSFLMLFKIPFKLLEKSISRRNIK
jgi:glycosyltransferase involved in cell wall biosynthesis